MVSHLGGALRAGLVLAFVVCEANKGTSACARPDVPPLRIVVMDPVCNRLACDCVAGYAKRDYQRLAAFLKERLAQPVEVAYAEALALPQARVAEGVDLIIGKFSEVVADAKEARLTVRTLAMLSGKDGMVTQSGLFVVRQSDPARSIADLKGRAILFGPASSQEKHAAALAVLEPLDVPAPAKIHTSPSCNSAAMAVVEKKADAAVVSSYAMPLLEGCGTIDKGALRITGRTAPVPFIGVFATDRVNREAEGALSRALLAVRGDPALLTALESRDGFVALPPVAGPRAPAGWTDWRGPRRDAICDGLPDTLPAEKRLLWSRTLTGPAMSGLAADAGCLVVADKGLHEDTDIFRCLDADTGHQRWQLVYPAVGKMEFTNSPRANPVIAEGLVYLLGAFGDLHCVRLDSGNVVWKRNILKDFHAALPMWGVCSTPLLVGEKLILNPGAADASLVALERRTGKTLWTTPGDAPGYGSLILAEMGGVRQIVGHDAVSLGGWDPATGNRLWRLVPETSGDFNVPTPICVDGKLLVSTENNGTRLYGFDDRGRILPRALAANADLTPDTSTPVVCDGLVFGSSGQLMCLEPAAGLKTLWQTDAKPSGEYCSFIAGHGRVLIATQDGTLCLLKADKRQFSPISQLELFQDEPAAERDVWSHPAILGNRLYIRNSLAVYCFLL